MREISFFPSTSLSSQNAGAARFTDLVSILIESWRELTILTRNWTKRGQPELSDFSCTILAHATAKSMCLARSALPHHSRLTWPSAVPAFLKPVKTKNKSRSSGCPLFILRRRAKSSATSAVPTTITSEIGWLIRGLRGVNCNH